MNDSNFIFDAHLDLSMNAMEWNRELTWPLKEIREFEVGMTDKPDRAKGTVSLPEMRKGNIGLCVATQIGRYVKRGNRLPGWKSPQQAWAQTQGQLAWYRAMEESGEMVQIANRTELENHLALWQKKDEKKPIGYILSLEGADSLISIHYLENSYRQGLRAVGPAHYGPGTYAQGTDSTGGLSSKGRELLKEMEKLNIILDASHLNDECFREAMDIFHGPVWASHSNCRHFVPHNRQFNDDQIKELIERGAVIGVALDAWMLVPDWVRGVSTPVNRGVTLKQVVENMDHICQIAGNSKHVGIGSDLDGAFGTEQCPSDLDTIADLQKLSVLLNGMGYNEQDIRNIYSENFIRFLREIW
ncbi:MAG: membrane dipeptidase [Bacteroidales bacterium]